jgi:hypothetical protein
MSRCIRHQCKKSEATHRYGCDQQVLERGQRSSTRSRQRRGCRRPEMVPVQLVDSLDGDNTFRFARVVPACSCRNDSKFTATPCASGTSRGRRDSSGEPPLPLRSTYIGGHFTHSSVPRDLVGMFGSLVRSLSVPL